jgi:radical SAM superfamily enzyme YgiQ (UPF0313 family)
VKVLLATVPWEFREIYPESMSRTSGLAADRLGVITGVTEPLGMLYLAASLRLRGHEPEIFDGYHWEEPAWLEEISRRRPALLGLSLSSFSFFKAIKLVPIIKKMLPETTIVLGGPHATAVGAAALADMPAADLAIRGAGEVALAELADALEAGRDFTSIPGLVFRREGRLEENEPKPLGDLDRLAPPARDLVDMTRYRPSIGFYNRLPSISTVTTRGCPGRCKFCVSNTAIAFRSPGNVLAEIEQCKQTYGARHVLFWDEDIAVDPARTTELCEGMLDRNLDLNWCASVCIRRYEPQFLDLMKRAGCWKLLVGIETGVQKNLDTLGKSLDLEQVREVVANISRAGIETYATFMFGIPGETRAEAVKTISFANSLPLDYALFLNFTPFPGTVFGQNMADHGVFQGLWSTQGTSFVPHTMTVKDLKELRVMAYRRFYFRPRYIWRRLRQMRSFDDLSRNVRGFLAAARLRVKGMV